MQIYVCFSTLRHENFNIMMRTQCVDIDLAIVKFTEALRRRGFDYTIEQFRACLEEGFWCVRPVKEIVEVC